jgi:hypothetical protein
VSTETILEDNAEANGEGQIRFSQHFNIHRRQSDLEFVDILLETDILLFVDPYAFKINEGDWYIECNNLVVDFFQVLLDAIRAGNSHHVKSLLYRLHEPNSTHLGHSTGSPNGRGIGPGQADALFRSLRNSQAFQTGQLRDLADCELLIAGISNDKISDITTNVVNMKLIEFTQEQCRKWDVPMKRVPSGPYWCPSESFWKSSFVDLPVYKGKPVVLVPRNAIRRHLSVNSVEFYDDYMVPFLQMEHLNQNSSLCRVLKAGPRKGEKVKPWKKDVKGEVPFSKDEVFKFSREHPDILKKYKNEAAAKVEPVTAADIDFAVAKAGGTPVGITINYVAVKGKKVMLGNNVGGDSIGSNVGGSGVVNARDIIVYKHHLQSTSLEQPLQAILLKAREQAETMALSRADVNDVADDLGSLTLELEKPEHDGGRIRNILKRIGVIAPPVLSILQSAKIIAEFITGIPKQ